MPDIDFLVDPEVISAAIKLLALVAGIVGAILATLGSAFVATLVYIWKKTDKKVDRIATCLESLERTVSTDLTAMKGKIITIERICEERHKEVVT